MEQVFSDVNLSMSLLKLVGLLLVFGGIAYFFTARTILIPRWRNIVGFGCMIGILNAGLIITLGKIAFYVTPVMLITLIVLFIFNKLPHYKIKHLLGLLVAFIFSSLTFFIGIAGTFFHLAVEGKI